MVNEGTKSEGNGGGRFWEMKGCRDWVTGSRWKQTSPKEEGQGGVLQQICD